MNLPNDVASMLYNTATQPDIVAQRGKPERLSFAGVTFRNFALRADINRLQVFCDNYLNFIDDRYDNSGHYFKPAAPYVTLSMLNYGRMVTETNNLGAIAQHEVLFSVPVEWYKVNPRGELVFHDWAYVCPFIFVDNDQSLGVGREVYGWTKVRGWLQPVTSSWTSDPTKPRRLLSLATDLFPTLYSGDRPESRTLIEVVQDAPPSLLRSPVNIGDRYNPWWSASRNMRRSVSAIYDACEAMLGLPIFGYNRVANAGTISRMYRRLLSNMKAGLPLLKPGFETFAGVQARSLFNPASPTMNNITLKQFRDAGQPDLTCYQALVNSRIGIERFEDGGLLGGPNLMMGDISGGYRVHVHQYTEQPIVETLGLEVSETQHDEHGMPVAVLSPILPSWMACDLRYDMGTALCWRDRESKWSAAPGGKPVPREDNTCNKYNTTRSAAMQDSVGPFHYPDTTLRLLPLLTDPDKLQEFCDNYLNNLQISADGNGVGENRFEAWGSYVYMVITNYGDQIGKTHTEQNNLGQMANYEMAFWIPVKWHGKDRKTGEDKLRVAFLTPYAYCDSMRQAISELEVNGNPVRHSIIDSDDNHWLRESGPAADTKILATLRTLVMPALNMGQTAVMKTLFEVMDGDVLPYNADIPWAGLKAQWEPILTEDYNNKIAEKRQWLNPEDSDDQQQWQSIKDLFKNVAKNKLAINFIGLKQYRASGDINRFCYQALVLVKQRITTLWDVREIGARIHVGIHKMPDVPIVDRLGIKEKLVCSDKQSVISQIEPIRPFFIRASMKEEVGVNLFIRIVDQPWQRTDAVVSAPDKATQDKLRRIKEPKAVIESLLWDSWAGHDKTNPYSAEASRMYLDDDPEFTEFFMRPGSYGMRAVNTQVFQANLATGKADDDAPDS